VGLPFSGASRLRGGRARESNANWCPDLGSREAAGTPEAALGEPRHVDRFRHAEEFKKNPAEWMPWNYRDTLARLATPAAA